MVALSIALDLSSFFWRAGKSSFNKRLPWTKEKKRNKLSEGSYSERGYVRKYVGSKFGTCQGISPSTPDRWFLVSRTLSWFQ
jgi:hypothetical protein